MVLGIQSLGISSFISHFRTVFASSFLESFASTHLVNLPTITRRYWYPFVLWSAPMSVKSIVMSLKGAPFLLNTGTHDFSGVHYRRCIPSHSFPPYLPCVGATTGLPCSSEFVFCSHVKDHVLLLTTVDKVFFWGN